jgi:hypothetical protein
VVELAKIKAAGFAEITLSALGTIELALDGPGEEAMSTSRVLW